MCRTQSLPSRTFQSSEADRQAVVQCDKQRTGEGIQLCGGDSLFDLHLGNAGEFIFRLKRCWNWGAGGLLGEGIA